MPGLESIEYYYDHSTKEQSDAYELLKSLSDSTKSTINLIFKNIIFPYIDYTANIAVHSLTVIALYTISHMLKPHLIDEFSAPEYLQYTNLPSDVNSFEILPFLQGSEHENYKARLLENLINHLTSNSLLSLITAGGIFTNLFVDRPIESASAIIDSYLKQDFTGDIPSFEFECAN